MKTIDFELSKPIKAHGEEIHVLKLREPTGKDVRECGYAIEISKGKGISIKESAIFDYIERLAGIPPSSVDQLAPYDLLMLGALISGFFAPAIPE
jgi:hypothetical protein